MTSTFLDRAIELAKIAERGGNLPIGAVIVLDNQIIAEGANRIWVPHENPTQHAEMVALQGVPARLWAHV